jgi:hypothetical protein
MLESRRIATTHTILYVHTKDKCKANMEMLIVYTPYQRCDSSLLKCDKRATKLIKHRCKWK